MKVSHRKLRLGGYPLFLWIVIVSGLGVIGTPSFAETQEEGFRTFTSQDGREMQAKIVSYRREKVTIQRADGMEFEVSKTLFSKKDQDFVANWIEMQEINRRGALEVKARRRSTRKDSSSDTALVEKNWQEGYKVVVKNDSFYDFSGLRAEYRIFKFEDEVAATKKSQGRMQRKSGNQDLGTLARGEEKEFETVTFKMESTELKPGWRWANGGERRSEDEIDGIWVRIYKGDAVVFEYMMPTTIDDDESW